MMPRVPPGVVVGVHDVYLPDDYPTEVADRYYSEQYLLGALLLGRPRWVRLTLAAHYVSKRRAHFPELDSVWKRPELAGIETHGVALWFETSSG